MPAARLRRRHVFTTLLALCAACGADGARATRAQRDAAAQFAGLWDATFLLARTPLGGPIDTTRAHPPRVDGTLALVVGGRRGRDGALPAPATHAGVYTVDFRALGFEPQDAGPVPSLVATVVVPDTLIAALPAGAGERALALRGALRGDSIVGTWSYGGRAGGDWAGVVLLRRHRPAAAER